MKKKIIIFLIVIILFIFILFNTNGDVKKRKSNIKKEEKITKRLYSVDVKGAVNNPGVYLLKKGLRVNDAINISGGLLENADTSVLNLSKKIKDGMLIIVYTKKELEEYKTKEKENNLVLKEEKNTLNNFIFNQEKIDNKEEKMDVLSIDNEKKIKTKIIIEEESIVVLETEKIELPIKIEPEGTNEELEYTILDNEIAGFEGGKIVGKKNGITKLIVSLKTNPNIKDTVVINVIHGKIKSSVYSVQDKELKEEKYRIIIGAEPKTLLEDFMKNIENEEKYIKIYTKDGVEIKDKTEIAKTSQIIKLEINGKVYDESVIIIRGDIDGDGLVKISDKGMVGNHILKKSEIKGYVFYAGDIDGNGKIEVYDRGKIGEYILKQIDTLN